MEAPAEAPAAAEAPADGQAQPQPEAAAEAPAHDAPAEQAAAPGEAAAAPAEQPAAPAEPALFHVTVSGLPADCKDEDVRALFDKVRLLGAAFCARCCAAAWQCALLCCRRCRMQARRPSTALIGRVAAAAARLSLDRPARPPACHAGVLPPPSKHLTTAAACTALMHCHLLHHICLQPLQFPGLKEVSVLRDGEACTGGATAVFEAREGAEAAVAELNGKAAIPADAEQKLEVGAWAVFAVVNSQQVQGSAGVVFARKECSAPFPAHCLPCWAAATMSTCYSRCARCAHLCTHAGLQLADRLTLPACCAYLLHACLPPSLPPHHPPISLTTLPPSPSCSPGSPGGACRSRPRCRCRRASGACSARLLLRLPHGRAAGGCGRGVQLLRPGKQSRGLVGASSLVRGLCCVADPSPFGYYGAVSQAGAVVCGQSQSRQGLRAALCI